MTQTLKFSNGKFLMALPYPPENWKETEQSGVYATTDLRAAAALRQYADEKTKKIFDRIFQKRYLLPILPPSVSIDWLDPHQWVGVQWILTRSRSYLWHAPGAGKTAQAITAAFLSKRPGQIVIVCPADLTQNWAHEIKKFVRLLYPKRTSPEEIAIVPTTAKRGLVDWTADWLIVPDSMLSAPWVWRGLRKRTIRFLAVDEASRFKETTSLRSIILYGGTHQGQKYPGLYRYVRHVVFLDGSPMPNGRPMELWAPTYALCPEAIDCLQQQEFGFRYCGAKLNERGVWEFLHSSREEELRQKLTKDFMHVVREDELSHPERRRSLLFITEDVRSPEQKSWERRHLGSLDIDELDENASQGELAQYRKEIGLAKVPWAAGYIARRLQEGEQILVFAWHREVCQELAQRLKKFNPGLIIGGTPMSERLTYFEEFQKGKRPLLVGNSFQRGQNLQAGDRAIIVEPSWSDETNKQCEKRISRRGNDKLFTRCEYIVAPDSFDERLIRSLFSKERRTKRLGG